MKKLLLLLFAAALSLSASEPARAWGREGHETIAKIAERNLTKRAKKRIEKYLGGHSVVYYAKWMDEYRQTPEYAFTNDWHTAPVGADRATATNCSSRERATPFTGLSWRSATSGITAA